MRAEEGGSGRFKRIVEEGARGREGPQEAWPDQLCRLHKIRCRLHTIRCRLHTIRCRLHKIRFRLHTIKTAAQDRVYGAGQHPGRRGVAECSAGEVSAGDASIWRSASATAAVTVLDASSFPCREGQVIRPQSIYAHYFGGPR